MCNCENPQHCQTCNPPCTSTDDLCKGLEEVRKAQWEFNNRLEQLGGGEGISDIEDQVLNTPLTGLIAPEQDADIQASDTVLSAFGKIKKKLSGLVTLAFTGRWEHVVGKPLTFPPSSHDHDNRYYTETEIDQKLQNLPTTNHTHPASAITGLTQAIDDRIAQYGGVGGGEVYPDFIPIIDDEMALQEPLGPGEVPTDFEGVVDNEYNNN